MKKRIILASILTLLMIAVLPGLSSATIIVPSYGETGWQTFSHYFDEAWSGWVGIGVSDEDDMDVRSYLLIDNILGPGITNGGFELGLTGYTTYGSGASTGSSHTSYWGNLYNPTEGSNMAILDSINGDSGASTDFLDDYLLPPLFLSDAAAKDGSWIEFFLTALEGDTLSFDWMFDTTDYWAPDFLEDFAFLYAAQAPGGEGDFDNVEILAKIGSVPEPSTLLLLGAGLFGLSAYGRRKLKK